MRLSVGFAEEPSSPAGDKVAPHPGHKPLGSPPPASRDPSKKRASLEYLAMEVRALFFVRLCASHAFFSRCLWLLTRSVGKR